MKKNKLCLVGDMLIIVHQRDIAYFKSPHYSLLCAGLGIKGGVLGNPSVTIEGVTLDDAGVYACVLSNAAGDGRSEAIRIDVSGEYYRSHYARIIKFMQIYHYFFLIKLIMTNHVKFRTPELQVN